MASTPVSEAPPLANERNITNREAPISETGAGVAEGIKTRAVDRQLVQVANAATGRGR